MTERKDLLNSVATTIEDYRYGEIPVPTLHHVDQWVSQFDAAVQLPMLREMDFVLKKTYFSLEAVTDFLERLVGNKKLASKDPCAFWRGVGFLDIQSGGNSQHEMLDLLSDILQQVCGFRISECGGSGDTFVYLDDGIFTGNRVRRDLEAWVANDAPATAKLHVVTIALHSGGWHYAKGYVDSAIATARKNIDLTVWVAVELEDRKTYSNSADVLRPTVIPADTAVKDYIQGMQYPPTLRSPGSVGGKELFSSDAGKILLEQEFLKAGAKIRQMCPYLGSTQRPLGHMTLDTLGFGSMIVTFRNCPNNAPLALWVDDPWIPLFPRTTNKQTAVKRSFAQTSSYDKYAQW